MHVARQFSNRCAGFYQLLSAGIFLIFPRELRARLVIEHQARAGAGLEGDCVGNGVAVGHALVDEALIALVEIDAHRVDMQQVARGPLTEVDVGGADVAHTQVTRFRAQRLGHHQTIAGIVGTAHHGDILRQRRPHMFHQQFPAALESAGRENHGTRLNIHGFALAVRANAAHRATRAGQQFDGACVELHAHIAFFGRSKQSLRQTDAQSLDRAPALVIGHLQFVAQPAAIPEHALTVGPQEPGVHLAPTQAHVAIDQDVDRIAPGVQLPRTIEQVLHQRVARKTRKASATRTEGVVANAAGELGDGIPLIRRRQAVNHQRIGATGARLDGGNQPGEAGSENKHIGFHFIFSIGFSRCHWVFQRRPDAILAPSPRALSLAQATVIEISVLPATDAKPQSLPTRMFSRPAARAQRSM